MPRDAVIFGKKDTPSCIGGELARLAPAPCREQQPSGLIGVYRKTCWPIDAFRERHSRPCFRLVVGSVNGSVPRCAYATIFTASRNDKEKCTVIRTRNDTPGKWLIARNAFVLLFPGLSSVCRFEDTLPKSTGIKGAHCGVARFIN